MAEKLNYSEKQKKKKIQEIPLIDRPREKMEARGSKSLSNLELLVVLIGTGIKGRDVFSVAYDISREIERNFGKLTLEMLQGIPGVGKARSSQIIAAIEFAKRFMIHERTVVKNEEDVLPLVDELREKKQEYFLTLTLDGGHHLIEKRTVFIGTLNKSLIHPREIFADALTDRAAAIIFVHNHPSGDNFPSKEDILITNRLLKIADLVGIEVLDHIIITKSNFFSFKKKGMLDLENFEYSLELLSNS